MNKKIGIIIGIIVAIIIAGVAAFFIFSSSQSNDNVVEDTFEAHIAALKGDNSKLEELGIDTDYVTIFDDALISNGFSDVQLEAAENSIEKADYKVIEVIEIDETTYEVVFEIDSYPIVDSMLDVMAEPEKYLTEEELELYNASANGTVEEQTENTSLLFKAYERSLSDLEPTTETHSLEYSITDKEATFVDENAELNLIRMIVGMHSDHQYESNDE